MRISKTHPRHNSLLQREKVIRGVRKGITAEAGLIAQGRGEAFDYLLGEKTTPPARRACRAAAAALLTAKNPVLSLNGNVAVLCPKEYAALAKAVNAKVEINLFYKTPQRVKKIRAQMRKYCEVLCGEDARLPIKSARRKIDSNGQATADVVLVPLEDGDRTQALKKQHKLVIAIDLNPLSRTAKTADITIVDDVCRAVPLMAKLAREMKKNKDLHKTVHGFDNRKNLRDSLKEMKNVFH